MITHHTFASNFKFLFWNYSDFQVVRTLAISQNISDSNLSFIVRRESNFILNGGPGVFSSTCAYDDPSSLNYPLSLLKKWTTRFFGILCNWIPENITWHKNFIYLFNMVDPQWLLFVVSNRKNSEMVKSILFITLI